MNQSSPEGGSAHGHASTKIIRRLGYNESFQLALHTLDQYRGTIVACRYSLPSGLASVASLGSIKSRVFDAIARVVLDHPHLQMGIIGENSKSPQFVRLDQLDLHYHVDWRSCDDSVQLESQYLASIQCQLDARYSHISTRPGWRVVILYQAAAKSMELLYVWNHVHHDGMSGKMFHQQLLRNLNKTIVQGDGLIHKTQQAEDSWKINLLDSSRIVPPPPEILSSFSLTAPFLLKSLWKELKPCSIFGISSTHATWAPIQTSPFATRFHTFTVNNEIVAKVVSACHENRTTLTGLLHALVLLSLTSTLKDAKGFAGRTPYDMRHFLPSKTPEYPWLQPKESMCNYVSVLDHVFDADLVDMIRGKIQPTKEGLELSPDVADIVWSVSARIRREIQTRLDSAVQNDLMALMKFVSDWRPQLHSEARKPRYLSWLISNVGILDGDIDKTPELEIEQEEVWSIRRGELVLSAEVASAALSISVMTVRGEKMCVTCSWQDCAVDRDIGERLMDNLESWLIEIGS
ncbi:Alcohol acetyltransferase [Conoideocrella luteorostrata]|uniref:Alcohol acetyltransferase n=1 Tax=Conoideocrella luteorostrata TaxID=1105319 RepID=A0AAJ0FUF1_9HYPO|nr:Alcohol acetyltransferase [Conoideocrella luteorostrata]